MNEKRWTAADMLRMRAPCRRLLHIDAKEIAEDAFLIATLNLPPINLVKLGEILEKRHPEYLTDEYSMADIIRKYYGQEALSFVTKYSLGETI